MATVLTLDGTETIATLRAQLQHAEDGQIVLVVPRGVAVLRDPVYVRLLVRGAEQQAMPVAIVSRDRVTRENARAEGLPVYSSVRQVSDHWLHRKGRLHFAGGRPVPRESRVTAVGVVVAVFGGLLLASLALAVGLLVLPSATITLVPNSQVLSRVVEIRASVQVPGTAGRPGQIAARPIEADLVLSDQVPTTGRRSAPAQGASGEITLANRTDAQVMVPKGSRFAVPGGAHFYTLGDVTLEARQWSTGRVGVVALLPGSGGNVPAQAISEVVEPAFMFRLTVTNERPTAGGTDKSVNYVTLEDRNRLKAGLVERVGQEAMPHLLAAKTRTESIYPETVAITLIEESYDRAAGDEADRIALRLRASVRALAFDGPSANAAAIAILASSVPTGTELLTDAFRTAPLEAYDWDSDSVSFRMRVEGQSASDIDIASIRKAVLGKTAKEAEDYLANTLNLESRPRVVVQPAWATTVPRLLPRVEVRLASESRP